MRVKHCPSLNAPAASPHRQQQLFYLFSCKETRRSRQHSTSTGLSRCGHSRQADAHHSLLVRSVQAAERPAVPVGDRGPATSIAGPPTWMTEVDLPEYDPTVGTIELVIAGAGPSGLAVADRVSQSGFKVCIVDPAPLAAWPNNYGVWVDEFEAMGLADCLEHIWPKAKVFLDSTPSGVKFLHRPYARVDRARLKRRLLQRCKDQGVVFHQDSVHRVQHADGSSRLFCKDGTVVTANLVLDATGHARRLVEFDKPFNPGYQGAYGIIIEVEEHPFELDTMLFMDWRDDHTSGAMREANRKLPTFLYAMPFSKTRIFLEETSLVARPAVAFEELKQRLQVRMEHMGIKVKAIEEEEYCLIPMGGVLPKMPQRVLGIGGTGGMVHPSTGYMVARMLGAAPVLADALVEQLCRNSDRAVDSHRPLGASSEAEADYLAANVWRSVWPVQRLRQREFFTFGMDVLLKLDLDETRQFFTAFFSLSDYHWQGFLSAQLSFPELIGFGLSLFAKSTNAARLNLLVKGLPGLVVMLARLTSTVGYNYRVGKESEKWELPSKDEQDQERRVNAPPPP